MVFYQLGRPLRPPRQQSPPPQVPGAEEGVSAEAVVGESYSRDPADDHVYGVQFVSA